MKESVATEKDFNTFQHKIFLHQLLEPKLRRIGFFSFCCCLKQFWWSQPELKGFTKNRTQIFTSQTRTKTSFSNHGNLFSSVTLPALVFSYQNLTETNLILLGHARNQEPLNQLACTAKRCMSLDLERHHQRKRQQKTCMISSLTLLLELSLHSLRFPLPLLLNFHLFCL
ncbi:hypothetical protein OIU77_009633 [Salix suchowensis]|uniref:Uncharacterized protein n=1 Tax=Salix suchowensis TaxID=1278906 RepID=A0ABQ9AH80_9ROSI|nr:hypothetical protein OIU77_009633 [Salix suchowensis]